MENAEVHVERGAEQLQRAARYQVSPSLSGSFRLEVKRRPLTIPSLRFLLTAKVQEEDVYPRLSHFHRPRHTFYYYLPVFKVSSFIQPTISPVSFFSGPFPPARTCLKYHT